MKYIAHRGFWREPKEKNSVEAFRRAFELGIGVETDLRDDGAGNVVISHDLPLGGELTFADFLTIAAQYELSSPLALNIKADGLAEIVVEQMIAYPNLDYFVFDMSFPDSRAYRALKAPVFERQSEYENFSHLATNGIWLDAFDGDWYDSSLVADLLSRTPVCVVSAELHGRDYHNQWASLTEIARDPGAMLCTDVPVDAKQFFGEGSGE